MNDEKETARQTAERLWNKNKAKSFVQWNSLLPGEQHAIIDMLSDTFRLALAYRPSQPSAQWTAAQVEKIAKEAFRSVWDVNEWTNYSEYQKQNYVEFLSIALRLAGFAPDPDLVVVSKKRASESVARILALELSISQKEGIAGEFKRLGLPAEQTQQEKDDEFINNVRSSGRYDNVEQMKLAMAYARGQEVV